MATDSIKDLLSVTKDDNSDFVRDIKARMSTSRSELYSFKDGEMPSRLDELHYASVLGMGGLYPCPDVVTAILAPTTSTDESRKILELGCRTGIWCVEMANAFPTAKVVGIYKQPVPISSKNIPKNCSFEVDDLNADLSRFHGQIDLAFVRGVGRMMINFRKTMLDVEACLKPGGIAIFMDCDLNLCVADTNSPAPIGLDAEEGGDPRDSSWTARLLREFRQAVVFNGTDADVDRCVDQGMWDHSLIDPDTAGGASLCIPIGPLLRLSDKEKEERLNLAGALMRVDMRSLFLFESFKSPLLKHGISEAKFEEWVKRAYEELDTKKFPISIRWKAAWGRRRAGDNRPAPALVINPSTDRYALGANLSNNIIDDQNAQSNEYRSQQVYKTQEQAKKAADLREQNLRKLPATLVSSLKASK